MSKGFQREGFSPNLSKALSTVVYHSKASYQAPVTLKDVFVLEPVASGQGAEMETQPFQAIYWKEAWFLFRPQH